MLELRGLRHDEAKIVAKVGVDPDRSAQQPAEHRLQDADDVREIEGGDSQNLLAAEGEQLPRQVCGSVTCSLNLLKIGRDGFVRADLVNDEAGIAQNRRQQVVEVM